MRNRGSVSALVALVTCAALAVLAAPAALATDGTWAAGTANWQAGANWTINSGSGVYPGDGTQTNDIARIPGLAANSTITIASGVNIGTLQLNSNKTVQISGAGAIVFEVTSGNAAININNGGAYTISAPISLDDNLEVNWTSGKSLSVIGVISELGAGKSLTLNGVGGAMFYANQANTFGGGVTVNNVLFNMNNTQAAGNGVAGYGRVTVNANGAVDISFNPTASHRFVLNDLGALMATDGEWSTLTAGANLTVATGAMLSHVAANSVVKPAGLPAGDNYILGLSTNYAMNLTVGPGSGTGWKGIGGDRSNRTLGTLGTHTLTVNGNAELVSLGGTFTINSRVVNGGTVGIITKRGNGTVYLADPNNTFTGNVVVEAGKLAFGYNIGTSSRHFTTLAGGTLDLAGGTIAGTLTNAGTLNVADDVTVTGTLKHDGKVTVPAFKALTIAPTAAYSGGGDFFCTGQCDAGTTMADGVQFQKSVTLTGQFSQESDTQDYPTLAADGASTVVTFNGTWKADGGTVKSYMYLKNGGKIYVGSGASIDTVMNDAPSYYARQIWVFGNGTLEFDAGFVADASNGAFSTNPVALGAIRNNGAATFITRASQNLPAYTRLASGSRNGHFVFEGAGGGTWSVRTNPQTYDCAVWVYANATINTETDLTLDGFRRVDADYTAYNGLYIKGSGLTLTKTGAGTLNIDRDQAYTDGSILKIDQGAVNMRTDPGDPSFTNSDGNPNGQYLILDVNGAGSAVNFGATTSQVKKIDLADGASVSVKNLPGGPAGSLTALPIDFVVASGTGNTFVDAGHSLQVVQGGGSFAIAAGAKLVKTGAGAMTIGVAQNHGAGATLQVGGSSGGVVNINTQPGVQSQNTPAAAVANLILDVQAPNVGDSSTVYLNATGPAGLTETFNDTHTLKMIKVDESAAGTAEVILTAGDPFSCGSPGTVLVQVYGELARVANPIDPGNTMPNRADTEALWIDIANGWGNAGNGITTNAISSPTVNGLALMLMRDDTGAWYNGITSNILGDCNPWPDLMVDGNDVGVLMAHFFTAPGSLPGESSFTLYTWMEGDFNYDGYVDGSDLGILMANFMTAYTPPAGGFQSIPEPASLAILAAGAAAMVLRRRRAPRR